MENFNLDHLEKKTPYRITGNFFEEMQENVLKNTIKYPKKSTKFFKLNSSLITSIAAVLILIFGFTFLWKTNQTGISKPAVNTENNISKNTVYIPSTTDNSLKNTDIATITDVQKTIKSIEQEASNTKENSTKIAAASTTNDENYDQLLNSLSDEELTELTKNSDHDIYLELYN